ncbi:hypothetical protein MCETHM1_01152 [Flavobacteriaceae bacterium]|jgi:hypothetical protein
MKATLKFIAFVGVIVLFAFAFSLNTNAIVNFQKENASNLVTNEKLSASEFIQPGFLKDSVDIKVKTNTLDFVGYSFSTSIKLSKFKGTVRKAIVSNLDFNRSNEIFILLYPSHYFW